MTSVSGGSQKNNAFEFPLVLENNVAKLRYSELSGLEVGSEGLYFNGVLIYQIFAPLKYANHQLTLGYNTSDFQLDSNNNLKLKNPGSSSNIPTFNYPLFVNGNNQVLFLSSLRDFNLQDANNSVLELSFRKTDPPTLLPDGNNVPDGYIWEELDSVNATIGVWEKKGSNWVSRERFFYNLQWLNTAGSPSQLFSLLPPVAYVPTSIYLEYFTVTFHVLSGNSSTNYWNWIFAKNTPAQINTGAQISLITSQGDSSGVAVTKKNTLNTVLSLSGLGSVSIRTSKTDPPGTLVGSVHGQAQVSYRIVRN